MQFIYLIKNLEDNDYYNGYITHPNENRTSDNFSIPVEHAAAFDSKEEAYEYVQNNCFDSDLVLTIVEVFSPR